MLHDDATRWPSLLNDVSNFGWHYCPQSMMQRLSGMAQRANLGSGSRHPSPWRSCYRFIRFTPLMFLDHKDQGGYQ